MKIADAINEAIERKIEVWEDTEDHRPLHEALGLTWEEYRAWVATGELPVGFQIDVPAEVLDGTLRAPDKGA